MTICYYPVDLTGGIEVGGGSEAAEPEARGVFF